MSAEPHTPTLQAQARICLVCHDDHREGQMHTFTDAALAAEKAKWQAEALREFADSTGLDYMSQWLDADDGEPENPYESVGDALPVAESATEKGPDDER